MTQTEIEIEIFKIVLEKGLLAVIVVFFSWMLSRSLERLKASISWNGEVLRQRMETAKTTLRTVGLLKQRHLGVIGNYIIEGTGEDPRRLLETAQQLHESKVELSLLQASDAVLEALDKVVNTALDAISERPPRSSARLADTDLNNPDIPAENQEWLKKRTDRMNGAIRSFEQSLSRGFRNGG